MPAIPLPPPPTGPTAGAGCAPAPAAICAPAPPTCSAIPARCAPRAGIARASAAIDLAIGRGEEGGRARRSSPVVHPRHEGEARVARAFFSAAVVAALACAHRLWLADLAGAGASLGMTFFLAGFTLRPAYRCLRIRVRLAEPGPSAAEPLAAPDPRSFLRRPALWWPAPLPDDPA